MNEYYYKPKYTPPLRAEGNLNHRQFIAVLKTLWEKQNPDIKILPTQGNQFANYPCIVYGVEFKKTLNNEPKRRLRTQDPTDPRVQIYGQRFQVFLTFACVDKNPERAEEIVEAFEDFVFEHIPAFKRAGVSEIVYGRRLSDNEENRNQTDVAVRTVGWLMTEEKIWVTRVDLIEEIAVDIRLMVDSNLTHATPVDNSDKVTVEITNI